MSIIENAERYMKRYDYLMEKRERKYKQGKRLTEEEDEELQKLRPNVFTPIFLMFELLHDTVKTNQEFRKLKQYSQHGGNGDKGVTKAITKPPQEPSSAQPTPSDNSTTPGTTGDTGTTGTANAKESGRLVELEESLLPLLTKIIVFIEQNKKAAKKKEEKDEEEKYPDIGTTAKNSAILVVRRIKKWWNDLISGGSSDLSSKINLKKAIPQLPDNPDDLNKLVDKATTAVHEPLKKIEKLLSNDVRDIASSSVEGIMNALSLIPGIGTTLQLWRLLQNVIVIMSKSVTTMAGAKTEGVALKTNVQGLKGEMEGMANNPQAMAGSAMGEMGAMGGQGAMGAMDAMGAMGGQGAMGAMGAMGDMGAMGAMGAMDGQGGTDGNAAAQTADGGTSEGVSVNAASGGLASLGAVPGGGALGGMLGAAANMANAAANPPGNASPGGTDPVVQTLVNSLKQAAIASGVSPEAAAAKIDQSVKASLAQGTPLNEIAKTALMFAGVPPGEAQKAFNMASAGLQAAGITPDVIANALKDPEKLLKGLSSAAGAASEFANLSDKLMSGNISPSDLWKMGKAGFSGVNALSKATGIPITSLGNGAAAAVNAAVPGGVGGLLKMGMGMSGGSGSASSSSSTSLRSTKKYKREYKQSLREIRKTRKRIMRYLRNII